MIDHPITPSSELVDQWCSAALGAKDWLCGYDLELIATTAARWGADRQLEQCVAWLDGYERDGWAAEQMRSCCRPKPPSLKEQALETLRSMQIEPFWINGVNTNAELMSKYDILRRALEALDG